MPDPKPEPLSAYLRRMNASPGAEGKAMWPQIVSSVRRLEAIEAAAEWVVLAWDNEQTQHLTMPALREALGWPRERPSLEEARRRLNAKCGIEASSNHVFGADDEAPDA